MCLHFQSLAFAGAGGGCKKLFRKIGNRSSEFYPEINEVRQGGSWYVLRELPSSLNATFFISCSLTPAILGRPACHRIYEEFVETQGTDVKMYTVGPEYGHAEARCVVNAKLWIYRFIVDRDS